MPFIANQANYQKGIALREEILGPEHVRRALAGEDDLIEYHHLFGHECAYAQIWSRKTFPPALRSMCVVGMAAAVSPRSNTFKAHVLGAARNGVTRRQMRQVLATISFYLGAGAGTDCVEAAREALKEYPPLPASEDQHRDPVSAEVLKERGLRMRRAILGDEGAAASETDGAASVYDSLKTNYYFGVLWHDPELDLKSRVLVVVSILLAANRQRLLRIYLAAARRLGCTQEELDEVFLTAAIYCGAPACEDAIFAAAGEE